MRRKPKAEGVKVMAGLYQMLLDIERKAGARDAIDASTQVLLKILTDKGMGYDEFVLSI